jgi:hypothetical protein
MKLLGRKFIYDPFLYCFGSIKAIELLNEDAEFQLLIESEGKFFILKVSPSDHFADLVKKVIAKLNIARQYVHFLHNGKPLAKFI